MGFQLLSKDVYPKIQRKNNVINTTTAQIEICNFFV
jgi:hypothetical protein